MLQIDIFWRYHYSRTEDLCQESSDQVRNDIYHMLWCGRFGLYGHLRLWYKYRYRTKPQIIRARLKRLYVGNICILTTRIRRA